MEHRPLISIMTPCHRVIPWFNARLINVCSQSFKDWEWIILDNSKDGCVKKYVDDFFVSMQGVHYPECRDKIKCVHEPFEGISMENGRMGVLRNRCIELSSCGDDGWILTLDSDDFIYDDFLHTIYDVSCKYPFTEAISGMCCNSLMQYTKSGGFAYHSMMYEWVNGINAGVIETMKQNGFDGKGFSEYSECYLSGKMQPSKITVIHSSLSIPYTGLTFEFETAQALNKNGYPMLTGFGHPIVYKKGAFIEKIGGYVDTCYVEDSITQLIPFVFNNIVYVNRPVYVQCAMIDDDTSLRDSVSRSFRDERSDGIAYGHIMRVYDILGDCRKCVCPIMYV